MPYRDVTYDNGFTERFYYDETPYEEALRISRANSVEKFPSANHRSAAHEGRVKSEKPKDKCEFRNKSAS